MKRETFPQSLPTVIDRRLKPYKVSNTSSNTFYNNNNLTQMHLTDIDKLRDELIKIKSDYNKKTKEYLQLKIAYTKLNETNLENCKVIETLIKEANKNLAAKAEEPINEETQSDSKITSIIGANMSEDSLKKTTTHYYNQRFLSEIMTLRQELNKKDSLIQSMKNNSKVMKYNELNGKYAKTYQDYMDLTKQYNKSITRWGSFICMRR
jgi:hypothetical protein